MLWPIAMLGAYITGYDYLPYLGGYFYYFSAGALFAILQLKTSSINIASMFISFVLCLLYSAGNASLKSAAMGVDFSVNIVVLIVIVFFSFFMIQNTKKAMLLRLPFSKTLGALTYPVYLIHAHFGYMFISRFATEENKFTIYMLVISIVLLVAYFMHKVIEMRLSNVWKTLFMSTIYIVILRIQNFQFKVKNAYKNIINRT
jgi:peptidoglycan/LPS O-acetylase OafA/YrhL